MDMYIIYTCKSLIWLTHVAPSVCPTTMLLILLLTFKLSQSPIYTLVWCHDAGRRRRGGDPGRCLRPGDGSCWVLGSKPSPKRIGEVWCDSSSVLGMSSSWIWSLLHLETAFALAVTHSKPVRSAQHNFNLKVPCCVFIKDTIAPAFFWTVHSFQAATCNTCSCRLL